MADTIYIGKKMGKLSGCPGSGDSRLPLLFYPQPLGQLPVGGDLGGLIGGVDHHTGPRTPTETPSFSFLSLFGLNANTCPNVRTSNHFSHACLA